MKPKQTLAKAQDQLFGSIRSLAEQLIANAYSRYNPDEGAFSATLTLEKKSESDLTADRKADDTYTAKGVPALTRLGEVPRLQLREACPIRYAKAEQNFLEALRTYAEAVVYDAYSRYDPYDGGEFFTREAYEELLEALADDEVIPMKEIAEEFGIKW